MCVGFYRCCRVVVVVVGSRKWPRERRVLFVW